MKQASAIKSQSRARRRMDGGKSTDPQQNRTSQKDNIIALETEKESEHQREAEAERETAI